MILYDYELEQLIEYCIRCSDDYMVERITKEMLEPLENAGNRIAISLEILADRY